MKSATVSTSTEMDVVIRVRADQFERVTSQSARLGGSKPRKAARITGPRIHAFSLLGSILHRSYCYSYI